MNQYTIGRDKPLTTAILGKILTDFQTRKLPKLRSMWNYYAGKQKIDYKAESAEKPANKACVNYCYSTVQNYLGYIAGLPIGYENDDEELHEILNYNDTPNEDSRLLKDALIFGRAFEICYIDRDGKTRYKALDPRTCIPIYSDDLDEDLLYVVRFWAEDPIDELQRSFRVEVYDERTRKTYRSGEGFASFSFVSEEPHYFSQCPITVFSLNDDETSIFDQILTLQDAYNTLVSDSLDDADAFADAYLVLTGMSADGEDLKAMRANRCLMLDPDGKAEYLTKASGAAGNSDLMKTINDHIHQITCSPDFNDERFMAASGIALQYKLVGFENVASSIEAHFRKALQRRIELIYSIVGMMNGEAAWRDVEIIFSRNLPTDTASIIQEVNALRGLVSDQTLLQQIPFVKDAAEELEKAKAEHPLPSLYELMGANNGDQDREAELLA